MATAETVTAAADATAAPAPNAVSSLVWVVCRTGTAAYEPAGTAYPGRALGHPGAFCGATGGARGPRCRTGRDAAVRAERGVRNDVVAVRAQHLRPWVHLIMRFVQQRRLHTNSQGQQRKHRDEQVQPEVEATRERRHLHQSERNVKAKHHNETRNKQHNRTADGPYPLGG